MSATKLFQSSTKTFHSNPLIAQYHLELAFLDFSQYQPTIAIGLEYANDMHICVKIRGVHIHSIVSFSHLRETWEKYSFNR
jgi:hypothetical protein